MRTTVKPEYAGNLTFDRVHTWEELKATTPDNAAATEALLKELPTIRAGWLVLAQNDRELEAWLRSAVKGNTEAAFELIECLEGVAARHEALVKSCRSASARLTIVLERVHNGPRKAKGRTRKGGSR